MRILSVLHNALQTPRLVHGSTRKGSAPARPCSGRGTAAAYQARRRVPGEQKRVPFPLRWRPQ